MLRKTPNDQETTEERAAKDFDLLSAINGYPDAFSVFEGETLVVRCARKPADSLPLPRYFVRALWRYKISAAIRKNTIARASRSHAKSRRKPAAYVGRIEFRDPLANRVVCIHECSEPTPIFGEMPASYRDAGADYTCCISVETRGLPVGVYECVVHDHRGRESQDIYFNVKPRTLENIDLLCVLPGFTWQAYNRVGGGSFYSPELGHRRTVCSQRPMHHHSDNSIQPALSLLSAFRSEGVRFACIDSWDLHHGRFPEGKVPVVAILVHDEYWSAPMRAQIELLLERGASLLVLAGNTCWWHIEVDGPNISVDKEPTRSALWHRRGPPEEQTFISSYRFAGYAIERARQKARLAPRIAHLSKREMYEAGAIAVTDPHHPIFRGIVLEADSSFGHELPVVYREIDGIPLDFNGKLDRTRYRAPNVAPHIIATGLTLYGRNLRKVGIVVEAQVRNGYVLHMGSIGWGRGVWRKNEDVKKIVMNAYNHCHTMAGQANGQVACI